MNPEPDALAALLRVIDERAEANRPPGAVMGTVVSLSPFTVTLDTGQVIVNPAVFTSSLDA